MRKNKKNKEGVIYSTNPNFKYEYTNNTTKSITNNDQKLDVCIDKHRGGKVVIIIKGFVGSNEEIKNLAKFIKVKCGVGGGVKNQEIIIQGNIREKIMQILKDQGYVIRRVGG
tara:strand:+ start:122 stop:460 length:339 start_codon:yes stop_codon:yes gene_type:complete